MNLQFFNLILIAIFPKACEIHIKNERIKTFKGNPVFVEPKKKGMSRNLIGGIIFGLGWALGGACPGPMYILLGKGVVAILVVLFGAHLGAFLYHAVKHKLPH